MPKPTLETPMDSLLLLIKQLGSASAAARALGVTRGYVHDILCGRREISARIADLLGWKMERVVTIRFTKSASVSMLPINPDGLTEEQITEVDRPVVMTPIKT